QTLPMHYRVAKVAVSLSLAAYALLVAYNNVVDYGSNHEFVRQVLSMADTFPESALRSRAVHAPALWAAAYWAIIAAEALTGLALLAGSVRLLQHLRAPAARFEAAKRWVVLGCALGFVLWFFGFLVVGGEWFAMWQSETWNGQQSAFRLSILLLAALIFVAQPERELHTPS